MSTVESIEKAIENLPPADLVKLREWFAEFDAANWNKQMEADAAAGKLDTFAAEAQAEYKKGKAQEL